MAALQRVDQRTVSKAHRHALHIRCPHCRNPIELVEEREVAEIVCPSCGSSISLTDGETTPYQQGERTTIGHLELVERIGAGAFGTVWRARDIQLDRIVAVKIPRMDHTDEETTRQFLREAQAAAQLRHPNVVGVHEVGIEGKTVYIVSDFVDGVSLADRLTAGPFNGREAAELSWKIAQGLQEAHQDGVIHRDLKPSNIILDAADEPHLTDFGLAKREAGEITVTVEGKVLGTPAYMSPEQARGEAHQADCRSDVYSLASAQLVALQFGGVAHSTLMIRHQLKRIVICPI